MHEILFIQKQERASTLILFLTFPSLDKGYNFSSVYIHVNLENAKVQPFFYWTSSEWTRGFYGSGRIHEGCKERRQRLRGCLSR